MNQSDMSNEGEGGRREGGQEENKKRERVLALRNLLEWAQPTLRFFTENLRKLGVF